MGMMYRLVKRYLVTVIVVFFIFWLCIDLMWIQWRKEDVSHEKNLHNAGQISQGKNNDNGVEKPVFKRNIEEKSSDRSEMIKPNTRFIETVQPKKHFKDLNNVRHETITNEVHKIETEKIIKVTTPFQNEAADNMVFIDHFKQFYHYSLNPQPGSAGMEGAPVKNSVNEKVREDLGFKNYSFNELSSSKISLERSVPDNREDA